MRKRRSAVHEGLRMAQPGPAISKAQNSKLLTCALHQRRDFGLGCAWLSAAVLSRRSE